MNEVSSLSLAGYGVLRGRAVDQRREDSADTPHFQVRVVDGTGTDFRIAVNVKSQSAPSDLLYLVDEDFQHPVTSVLSGLGTGWNELPQEPGGASLDFVRANLFDPASMRVLPPDLSGPDNDLADVLGAHVTRAIGDPSSEVYAFGQRWGPEPGKADTAFGFLPGNGVHDIHMNQGNDPSFSRDDGVWQDGALLLHFPAASRWVAIFLAFQSQSWHTDDATGHALTGAPPRPSGDQPALQILAALVNAAGPAPERESVLVLNASPDPVDLTGWAIADRLMRVCALPPQALDPGMVAHVPVTAPAQLGNEGGAITLLDPSGLKVHGVTYTADQARREGWTIGF